MFLYLINLDLRFCLTNFNMGEHSAKTTKKSTMVVESHITYDQEVKEWRGGRSQPCIL